MGLFLPLSCHNSLGNLIFVLIPLILIFTSAEFSVPLALPLPNRSFLSMQYSTKYEKLTFLLHLPKLHPHRTASLQVCKSSQGSGSQHSRALPCTGPSSGPPSPIASTGRASLVGSSSLALPVSAHVPDWRSLYSSFLHPLHPPLPLTLRIVPLFLSK